ncbi:MAG: hypothetical protein N2442_14870 [Spirochaetes bacterium]|nr:hypothetical protein [Spirochaetota bacterium]
MNWLVGGQFADGVPAGICWRRMGVMREEQRRRREVRFTHWRMSGRQARSQRNPLVAVNYLDREVRKDGANHVRESTRRSCNMNDLMNRLAIYRVVHNYRKSYRLRPNK